MREKEGEESEEFMQIAWLTTETQRHREEKAERRAKLRDPCRLARQVNEFAG